MALTNIALGSASWDATSPVSIETGFDLRRAEDRRRALDLYEAFDPDAVVTAPPCSWFSQLQWLNQKIPGRREETEKGQLDVLPLYLLRRELAQRQAAKGKYS